MGSKEGIDNLQASDLYVSNTSSLRNFHKKLEGIVNKSKPYEKSFYLMFKSRWCCLFFFSEP